MNKLKVGDLVGVTDGQLTEGLYRLCGSERAIVVEQLIYLAEIERRSLHVELGYSSTFELCRRFLGHIKSKAYRRSTAARLLARFPVLADYLRDGRLCVTTLTELRDVLVEDRLDEILTRAAGKTEEEVKELVAALRPQPAPPDLFRRLPAPAAPEPRAEPAQPVFEHAVPAENRPAATERPPGKIEPISEELRVLRITVGKDFADDLARARAAFGGDIAQVLHHGLRVALEVHERKRRGTGMAPRGESKGRGRYVPAHVRDAVWRRDEGCCAYVGPTGVRCTATGRLHMHHILAYALGGKSTVENLSLRCPAHNRHHAVKDFGTKHIARAIEQAKKR